MPFQRSLPRTHRPIGSSRVHVHRALSTDFSDDNLLSLRMCDLGLKLAGTWLEDRVGELCADLKRRGIRFCPHTWLSHDWFSPDGVPGIAIPFYLAHPRLMRLERRQIRQVEGGSREECMKILRHECGHAIQHAYQLQRRRGYQRLFGKSSQPYPESYRPNPASRRYVQHLPLYYAQSHPDEDFAETFAVWLQPRSTWRKRYHAWPALKKLAYVDGLMAEIKQTRPVNSSRRQIDPVHSLKIRLRDYYADKRARYDPDHTTIYDRDLLRLFPNGPRSGDHDLASKFLRCHRREIRTLVGTNTGTHLFAMEYVLAEMIGRCRELKLRAVGSKPQLLHKFSVLLTVKTALFLSRRFNRVAL